MQSSHAHAASTLEMQRSTLTLELTDLRNRQGVICIALFAGPNGFPSNPAQALRSGCFSIADLPCAVQFEDIPFGWYAVAAHHDENMDGQLNCNALGIPKEGIGFSGNPRIWKGAPPFQKAAFEFVDVGQVINITMKYLLR